jgi:hypothetical protein
MKSQSLQVLTRTVSALAVGALLGATSFAQAPATPAAPGAPATGAAPAAPAEKPKQLASADEAYVKNAVRGMNYIIQLAKTLPVSTEQAVQTQNRLRDSTVKDLTAALAALAKITDAHGMKIPAELVGNDKNDVERIAKGFSKPPIKGFENKPLLDWTGEMLKETKRLDHETEIVGKQGQDADLKTFATNYGPSMHSAFMSAEGLEKSLKTKKK